MAHKLKLVDVEDKSTDALDLYKFKFSDGSDLELTGKQLRSQVEKANSEEFQRAALIRNYVEELKSKSNG